MTDATWNAIAIHPRDSVAVVLRDIGAGETVLVRVDGRIVPVLAKDPVPLGHKIACVALAAGSPVVKYGATIGLATREIVVGEHVHVHNIASNRAKKKQA